MSLAPTTPSTMLGIVAQEQWRAQKSKGGSPKGRGRVRLWLRRALAAVALTIGVSGFTMGTAQAWIFDDMKDNIASTIVNMCGPNDVATPVTYQNIDTLAGLNENPTPGIRSTVRPTFQDDANGSGGGNARERLQIMYGSNADIVEPTYERYGFSPLRWNQYGYDCFSPTLLMGPASNMALFSMVHVPMMISMSVLNLAMDNTIYTGFAVMMQPFIGGMYALFSPWIFFIVPIGVGLTWVASKGSLQATTKAVAWGVFMLSVFLLMGSSTSQVVTWSTNIVTEVAGSAACKMNAAAVEESGASSSCDPDDPIKAVNQALWYGVPYQTWLVGQVGESEAAQDREAQKSGQVTWGAALLNGNYVGTDENGNVDPKGRDILTWVELWNGAPYTDDGKVAAWGKHDMWQNVPALANVKVICNDQDKAKDDPGSDPSKEQRWMYSGAAGESEDGSSFYCDSTGAGTTAMTSTFRGDEYNKQFLVALSGMVGVGAIALTIGGAAIYLAFQKMSFFFLLFFAPIVLTISALGDNKRRPFAVRYAELIAANLLKQVAAVCIVLFVSHAMASLFGSSNFSAVPWIMKPYIAGIFFLALVMMAFPMKNLLKGAVQGDTSALDKIADTPANLTKGGLKLAAVGTAVVATGGAAAAMGGGTAMAGLGGKAAAMGKGGTMLGQAGKLMGMGSKTGKAMRASGALMKAGQGVMESKDAGKGKQAALGKAAASLLNGPDGKKYRDEKGQLLPNAQKMAMKDAQKMADSGQKSDRATKAQDAQMAQFFQGYKAKTGQFHQEDPQSPENKRVAATQLEKERRQARSEADTQLAKENGQPLRGETVPGGKGGDSKDDVTDYTPTKKEYQDKARENLGGPAFAREMDYNVATVSTGEEVLRKNGLTKDEVLADPTTLLRGDAYEGGATTKMDPFHPATGPLNELRFASSSGDEQAMESAVAKAVDAIAAHGAPNQISGVTSIGDRAVAFEGIELLGAMPSITQDTPWAERAEAAHTMMAAQVAMPEGYSAREAVQEYTAALANPGVDSTSLEAVKGAAMEAVNDAMRQGVPPMGGDNVMAGSFVGDSSGSVGDPGPVDVHHVPVPHGSNYAPPSDYDAPPPYDEAPVHHEPAPQGEYRAPAPEAAPITAPSGGYDEPHVASNETAPAAAPQGDSIAREDLRAAVVEGLREGRLNQGPTETTPTAEPYTSATFSEAASHSDVPSSADTGPSGSNPVGSSQFQTPPPPPRNVPSESAAPVEAVPEDEGMYFRPSRKRRHDDEEGED